ncbi:zinc ribbon domain-containing protein [Candidatus Woesearchaeota archaeon]|nr:zinc ribbon domain-containing protein [Candidatus Woesearchaeota archaeon]
MAKIPGIVWLLVGAAVAWYSSRPQYADKFVTFFYVGLAFVAIGLFKIFTSSIRPSKAREHHQVERALHQYKDVRFCPRCGHPNKVHDYFCSRCGTRLR